MASPSTLDCDGVTYRASDHLKPTLAGDAVFFKWRRPVIGDTLGRAWMKLDGTYRLRRPGSGTVDVKHVIVSHVSGDRDLGELCDALHAVPWAAPRWRVRWLESRWDYDSPYWVRVRYYYDFAPTSGAITHCYQDSIGAFEDIELSEVPEGVWALGGTTITGAYASGSFWSTQGIALYDVRVEYTPPVSTAATSIEVFAAPHGTAGFPLARHRIHVANNPGSSSWEGVHLEGPYSGADAYDLRIQVNYSNDTSEWKDGSFSGISPALPATLTPHERGELNAP